MAEIQPISGPGYFQWNSGAWFGSQLGCTLWMLVGAAVLATQTFSIAVLWFGCFTLANVIGTSLWRRRDRLLPYTALQLLLMACTASGLLALLGLDLIGRADLRLNLIWQDSQIRLVALPEGTLRSAYMFSLLFVPVSLGYFAVLERAAIRRRSNS